MQSIEANVYSVVRGGFRCLKGSRKSDSDKFLSISEFDALLKAAKRDPRVYGETSYDLFTLCGNFGLRCSEALDLEFSDFAHLNFNYFTVRTLKKRSEVEDRLYVGNKEKRLIEGMLSRRKAMSGTGTLFPFCARSARYYFGYYANSAGISRNVSFHSLRHTAARLLLEANGNDMRLVKERLRHSLGRSDITMVYVKPTPEEMIRAGDNKGVIV